MSNQALKWSTSRADKTLCGRDAIVAVGPPFALNTNIMGSFRLSTQNVVHDQHRNPKRFAPCEFINFSKSDQLQVIKRAQSGVDELVEQRRIVDFKLIRTGAATERHCAVVTLRIVAGSAENLGAEG